MNAATLLALAAALAMDAFAVAVASGFSLGRVTGRHTFRLAFHFGLFQALMPVLGWWAGHTVASLLQRWDHWLAFGLLAFIGGRMVWGAVAGGGETAGSDPTQGFSLVVLSVATSVDALAVGLSLSLLQVSILWPAAVIGGVCAAFTVAGLHLGRLAGGALRLGRWAEGAGGLVLLAIGLRILTEHGVF
ncbi:MAG: manganese efflux pump MntP family protein [Acidobacteriota bacterium]